MKKWPELLSRNEELGVTPEAARPGGLFFKENVTDYHGFANLPIEATLMADAQPAKMLNSLPAMPLGDRLIRVRVVAKVAVALLGLLLAALPVMACARPGAAMTAAEHDCCKRMAGECGRSRMAQSHGCCQPQASPNEFHVLKVVSSHLNHGLAELHALPGALALLPDASVLLAASIASSTHSPPGLGCTANTVLRI
ncbi:MAG: hypothetical protein JST79_18120 [Acidobacteria bacterium]|nr:hypothetical protein [Acidobacteriota bacterium]